MQINIKKIKPSAKQYTNIDYSSHKINYFKEKFNQDNLRRRLEDDWNLNADLINRILHAIDVENCSDINDERNSHGSVSVIRPKKNFTNNIYSYCSETVIALSSERGKWDGSFTFSQSIDALINYYLSCVNLVNLGIVVTNVWRPSEFERIHMNRSLFKQNNINTIFILSCGYEMFPIYCL